MHTRRVPNPSPNIMFVLLSKHNAAMLDTCASQLDEVSVICADNASHLYSAIQLLHITFTKTS